MGRIIRKIKDVIWDIKMFIERGRKGYCREDIWSIDWWFMEKMPKMLGELIEIQHGYFPNFKFIFREDYTMEPIIGREITEEEYKHNLELLKQGIEEMLDKSENICRYNESTFNDLKNKVLDMFKEMFYTLWD